jgi:hypothetical protein
MRASFPLSHPPCVRGAPLSLAPLSLSPPLSLSLVPLSLSPSTHRLAFSHLPWVSIGLVLIFAYFTYDGLSFRRQLDRKFQAMGQGATEVRPATDASETIQASFTPSRSCCVEVSTVSSRAGGGTVPAKASVLPRPREPPQASAHAECGSGGEGTNSFLRTASDLASSPLSKVSKGGSTLSKVSKGGAGACPSAGSSAAGAASEAGDGGVAGAGAAEQPAAAQSVRVSGWMYKSPSRLLAPASMSGGGADEPAEMVARRPSRRLSTTMLAAGRSASAKLLPSLNDGIPTPQDKRYFVLDGHDFRSARPGRRGPHTRFSLASELAALLRVPSSVRARARPYHLHLPPPPSVASHALLLALQSAGGTATRTR